MGGRAGGKRNCRWALGCPRSPFVPRGWGAPGMAPIRRDPGTGRAGKCWLAEGAIHPLRPLRGEPVIHPGSERWERPPSSAKPSAPVGRCRGGRRGGASGLVPQKGSGVAPKNPRAFVLPPCWPSTHRDGAAKGDLGGGHQGTVTPNCWPAAEATPPLPRLLLMAAHSSGTAALFTPDRSAQWCHRRVL